VAALLITGFAAPGFFLSKDDNKTAQSPQSSAPQVPNGDSPNNAPGGSDTAPTKPASSAVNNTIKDFITKLNAGDSAGAAALGCNKTDNVLQDIITQIVGKNPQLTAGQAEQFGTNISGAPLTGSLGGQQLPGKQPLGEPSSVVLVLENVTEVPCIYGVTTGSDN